MTDDKGITLRPMEPEDLDTLYNIENDMELWSVGYTTVPYSRYLLHDYIAHSTCDIYADRQVRLMAEDERGRVVGVVDLSGYEPLHNRAEIGLVIVKEFRDKGYGRRIVDTMIKYSQHVVRLHQLYAVVSPENKAAVAMFKAAGFVVSNKLKDWLFDGKNYEEALFMQLFM